MPMLPNNNTKILMLRLTAAFVLLATTTVLAFSPPQSSQSISTSIRKTQRTKSSPATTYTTSTATTLYYAQDKPSPPAIDCKQAATTATTTRTIQQTTTKKKTKIIVRDIKSIDELQFFLEEDDRPAVIKFHAPWCKTCQRLGLQFDKLARDYGDTILDRQLVQGSVRFAAIEFGSETCRLITETLQVPGVPTFQLYSGIYKLWQQHGAKTTRELQMELERLSTSAEDIRERAQSVDDGILENAIEERFFDVPDFLNEEW
mmetsp:Transcript_26339/g.43277  ORF Transcript_26339/g.43277 Transcript_26339/m.43277 type:complete len:260 (+) Transcript_26339:54-833(+)